MTIRQWVIVSTVWLFYYTAIRIQYEVVWIETAKYHYDEFLRRTSEKKLIDESVIEI